MEMTLTVHVPRRRPRPVDVVVEWPGRSTAAELCAALTEHLGMPVPGLSASGVAVPADAVVGMPPLLHGASVAVVDGAAFTPAVSGRLADAGVLDLVVVGGPDAGRRQPLLPPGVAVGRGPAAGLPVADESLSREHLVVGVGPGGVTVEDRGSTNGVEVDGEPVDGVVTVDATATVVVGSTTLRLRRAPGAGPPVRHPGDGTVRVTPTARACHDPGDVEVEAPTPPPERHRARVPWLAAVAPVPVAVVLALLLGPQLLVFAALGPVSLLAGALGDRWGSARARRRELAAHRASVADARARLASALRAERERLDRLHPDPAAVLATAEGRLGDLWGGGGTARVRLGLGAVPSRVVWVEASARDRPPVARAPVVADLAELGCLGVVGSRGATDGLLAALVGQLCTSNVPHELSLWVASSDPEWEWTTRLPHRVEGPFPASEESVASRGDGAGPRLPVRVLVVPGAGSARAALVSDAMAAGVLVVAAATTQARLPAGCPAVVECVGGGHVLETPGGRTPFVADGVGPWWVDRLSRALAPLRCDAPGRTGRMPSRLTLADALGGADLTPVAVAQTWRARHDHDGGARSATPTPSAVVGATADGPFVIDLCRDGPHLLVGGTTGSGKSEFLRTLVTSLAVSSPPGELSFVLVDFKGGAAFGPCAGLPHVVGLVTDLDDHLVSRALASLRAELRRRERVLAEVGASDLEGYQRRRAPGSQDVPRLVVVVDELRALVEELPEFVTGLVRLAALGRSLGVHLVLATQRPSGALGAEVQANVSLRIAFRVRDRADSLDVIDDGAAAAITPSTPGRALARGADGSLVPFQAAIVAGTPVRSGGRLTVRTAEGRSMVDPRTGRDDEEPDAATAAVVEAVREAHRLRGGRSPRTPWMPPLPAVVTAATVESAVGGSALGEVPRGPRPRTASADTGAVGLVDEPDLQQVTPLHWATTDGCWLLAGGPGSGRTTALRALALGAVQEVDPDALHLHVLDAHGSLIDLQALPHLGTRAGLDEPRVATALVQHLREEVNRRLAASRSSKPAAPPRKTEPTVLVLVDGWDQLVEAHPAHGADHLTGTLLRVLRDGRSVGVVAAVTGGRSLLHPRWAEVAGRTFLLGRVDPLDAALAGLRAADLPHDPPPGRGVRVHDRREVQFVQATAEDAATAARRAQRPVAGRPWRWVPLPAVARRRDVLAETATTRTAAVTKSGRSRYASDVLLGVSGADSRPCWWRPETDGRRLLVVGPPRSGRTNTLLALAESLCAAGRSAAAIESTTTSSVLCWPTGCVVVPRGDTDALVRLRRHRRDLAVLVDDADRLGDGGLLPVLREVVELADRDDGLVVVATSASALATRFSGIDVEVARSGCALVLNPEGADRVLGSAHLPEGIPPLPGRGVLVRHGKAAEVHVLLAEGSVGQVAPGEHLGVRVAGQPGGADGHRRHDEHQPPDDHPVALGEADADRQEQHVPDDGRGARP